RVNAFGSTKFEGTIHLKKNETIAATIRNKLNVNSTLLSVGFGQSGQQAGYGLSPVENSGTQIYGLGYLMNFTVGHGLNGNFSSGDSRVMTNLREYNLLNGQQT